MRYTIFLAAIWPTADQTVTLGNQKVSQKAISRLSGFASEGQRSGSRPSAVPKSVPKSCLRSMGLSALSVRVRRPLILVAVGNLGEHHHGPAAQGELCLPGGD